MNVLGLITARGGSKGIPGKNLVPCGCHPLLYWTCRAARESTVLSRTIISSDDDGIIRYAQSQGIEAPFARPAELAADNSSSIDTARHAIDWLAREEGWKTDVLVLLQPTSPLRTASHIDEAYALLKEDADSVVSVMEVPHQFTPWSALRMEHGYLRDYQQGDLPFDRFRRQGQPAVYARNGPAVIVSRATLIDAGTFYGERCVPYLMSPRESVDIDTPDDLLLADWLLRQRQE